MRRLLLTMGLAFGWSVGFAQTNIAPSATVTASTCNTGPCSALNDLNFGTCGTQEMWISTSSPPSTTIGVNYIEWNWSSVQAFDEMTIHHAQNNARSLTGFTMQRHDGTGWVTIGTVSNLPQACINSAIAIPKTFTDRFRITAFQMTGSGQTSNPNFREIEIFQASTSPDDAGIASVDQSLTSSCPGTYPVFVNLENFGTNQITTVDIEWEVNGVAQTPVTYSQLLDTANGTGPSSALVNLGNITYAPSTNYVVKAWTTMPNMGTDTVNDNDTATATLALGPPQGLTVSNVVATSADINFGAVPGITYQAIVVPAGTPASAGIATPASSTSPITVTGLTPSTAYDAYVFADCGSSFSDTAGPEAFTTPIQGPRGVTCITGLPGVVFAEDFESSSPNVTGLGSGNGVWRLNSGGTPSGSTGPLGAHQGSQYIYYETSGANPTSDSIVTGAIDLTTANDSAEMSFWLHAFGAQIGTLTVGVGTSASGPFTPVFTRSGAVQAQQGDPWQNVGVRLDSYVGQTIYVQFSYTSGTSFTGDLAIDQLEISSCVTCPNPGNLSFVSSTANSIDVSWSGSASTYEVTWDTVGFTPGTSLNSSTVTGTSTTISGLSANTGYDIYVRADCSSSSNGFSGWIGPVSARTLCTIFTAPFSEDFDGSAWVASGSNANNDIDACWDSWPPITDNSEPFKWIPRSSGPTSGNGPTADATGVNFLYCEASGSSNGDSAWIQTPAVDVSGLTTPSVWFEQHRFSNGSSIADMKVQVSSDFGATWSTEYTITGEVQTAISDPFELVFVNLGAYVGDTIIVRFQQDGNGCCGDAAIDNVEIKEAPTCPWPTNQAILGATDTSATLAWSDPTGTNWDIEWGPVGFTQGTGAVTSVTNDTVTFGPLSPNTCYDVYVRANCTNNSNGVSIWRGPIEFCTQCAPFTAPYTQDYDGTTAPELDNCWIPLAFNPSATNYELQTDAFRNNSAPNSMEIHNASATSGFLGIASPRFSDLDTGKRIEFNVYDEDGQFGGSDLIIGVMSDLSDETTFEAVDTILETDMDNDVWDFFVVDLTGHTTNNGGHVVFRHGMNTTFDNIHVDDFEYKQIPACQPPLASTLGITGVSTTQATATWGSGSQGVKTYFAWGTTGFVPQVAGQLGIDSVAGSIDQGVITGLGPQTTYEYYIQDSCIGSGLSPWVGPFTFTTPCLPASMPYYESFDSWALACWDSTGGNSFWQPYNAGGGVQYARADFWANSTGTYHLTTRPIVISVDAQVRFDWSHLWNAFYDEDQLLVMVKSLSATTWDTILNLNDASNFNDPSAGNFNTPGNFIEEEVLLDPFTYTGDTVQVKLVGNSDWGPDCFLNDFYVEAAPSCPKLANVTSTNVLSTSADFTWSPSANANSYEVWYGPQGFYQGTLTAGGTRVTGPSAPLSATGLTSNTCYEFLARAICGPGDTSEWEGPFVYCTPCAAFTAPYTEDFTSSSVGHWDGTDNCWDFVSNNPGTSSSGGYSWEVRNSVQTTSGSSTGPLGDNTIYPAIGGNFIHADVSGSGIGDSSMLVSPLIDISSLSNPELEYALHRMGTQMADLYVDVYDGTQWVNGLHSYTSLSGIQTSQGAAYIDTIIDLSSYSTVTNFRVRFRTVSNGCCAGDNALDDIRISDPITCPAPLNLSASNFTATSADISWSNAPGTSGTNFQIAYDTLLSNPASGITQLVTGTNTTLNNLLSSSQYCYYVREICAPGDTSLWSGPFCFNTLCTVFTAPYTEDFENHTLGFFEGDNNCWTIQNTVVKTSPTSGYGWELRNTQQTSSTGTGADRDNTLAPNTGGQFFNADVSYGSTGDSSMLISPIVDISTLVQPELEYHIHRYGTQMADFFVDIYDGTQWINGVHAYTNQTGPQTANSDPYQDTVIDLSPYIGTVNFQVRFRTVSNGCCAGDNSFDDVSIYDASPGCTVPSALSHNALRCDSVEVSWNSGGATINSVLEYGPVGFTPGTGTLVNNAASPQLLSGLTANTGYDVYVVDICATDTSAPAGPYTFNTGNAGAPVASYTSTLQAATLTGQTVDFDGSASTGNGATYTWDFGDGNGGTGVSTSHTYTANGTYNACLIVTNACDSDTTCQQVVIEDVGLAENLLSRSLDIFPNPAADVVNVSFETVNSGDVSLRLLDGQGREVMVQTEKVNGNSYSTQLSVKNLSRGMYILEIESGDVKARRSISVQ